MKKLTFMMGLLLSLPLCTVSGQTEEKIIRSVHVDEGSSLKVAMGDDRALFDSLVVTGFLHHSDFRTLNALCHECGVSGINLADCKLEDDSIPEFAFVEMQRGRTMMLRHFTFPNDLHGIGRCAFSYTNLETIDFPETLRYLGEQSFFHMANLRGTLRIPEGVRELPMYCFSQAPRVHTVILPSTLETMGNCCLFDFPGVTEIELPEGLKSIGMEVISGMMITKLRIPESVERIKKLAFYSCRELEEVWLPSHLTEIPVSMFEECTKLKTVHMPETIESIGSEAFYGTGFVNTLFLPDNIRSIGFGAFEKVSMSAVVLPASLEVVEPGAFWECTELKAVYSKTMIPARLGVDDPAKQATATPMFPSNEEMTLYVPRGAKAAYESDPNWRMFTEIVEVDEFPSGIGGIEADHSGISQYANDGTLVISADGRQLTSPAKGLNIVRMKDGSVRKVMVR